MEQVLIMNFTHLTKILCVGMCKSISRELKFSVRIVHHFCGVYFKFHRETVGIRVPYRPLWWRVMVQEAVVALQQVAMTKWWIVENDLFWINLSEELYFIRILLLGSGRTAVLLFSTVLSISGRFWYRNLPFIHCIDKEIFSLYTACTHHHFQ